MKTRTFANREELMIALLQGERWQLDDVRGFCYYDNKEKSFRLAYTKGKDYEIGHLYDLCNGKALWHKVEEKTELDLMKEKYASGDYVCIYKREDREYWNRERRPSFHNAFEWKLIHKKHTHISDAYLADDSVEIEFMGADGWEWYGAFDFIRDYNEAFEYRLKPKKKTVTIIKFYSSKGKILEMDKSKLSKTPKNIINEYELEVEDEEF